MNSGLHPRFVCLSLTVVRYDHNGRFRCGTIEVMHCIGCFRYEFGVLCCYDTKYFQSMFVSFVLLCFVRNGVNKKRLEGCDSGVI